MVKILLSGACGKMGRVIARCVAERTDCVVAAGVDLFGEAYGDFPVYKAYGDCKDEADVIIDFSNPSALDDLLSYAKEHQLPLVLATTVTTTNSLQNPGSVGRYSDLLYF